MAFLVQAKDIVNFVDDGDNQQRAQGIITVIMASIVKKAPATRNKRLVEWALDAAVEPEKYQRPLLRAIVGEFHDNFTLAQIRSKPDEDWLTAGKAAVDNLFGAELEVQA